jgi:crotonobetainyl-CoA:carnitine CoA-transferase CaiB-like acyl-CoA transferase
VAPIPGQDSRAVLASLGMTASEIEKLVAEGAIG